VIRVTATDHPDLREIKGYHGTDGTPSGCRLAVSSGLVRFRNRRRIRSVVGRVEAGRPPVAVRRMVLVIACSLAINTQAHAADRRTHGEAL
jgi:hypothetical protein